jgi:putative peptide maturation system protein
MSTIVSASLLGDALAYLTALAAEQANPAAAQRRLHKLRSSHPAAQLRLVWQREQYDGSLQYDLLITHASSGTVSMSYCPDRALPWPFRGGQRASERLLLRVNRAEMELDNAIACLDFLWDESPLAERLVTACLLREELEQHPVELDETELQHAMDAFRRARGLLTTAATRQWMARRCLSHRDLEELVAGEAAVARLRKRKTAGRVRRYFERSRCGLDSFRVAELVFASRVEAGRAAAEIQAGCDFYAGAERALAAGVASSPGGFIRTLRRDELPPQVAEHAANAPTGTTIGPCSTAHGHSLIRVLAVERAVLDEPTTELIERRLFADWLDERRRSARIEWFWGNAARTAAENNAPLEAQLESTP